MYVKLTRNEKLHNIQDSRNTRTKAVSACETKLMFQFRAKLKHHLLVVVNLVTILFSGRRT